MFGNLKSRLGDVADLKKLSSPTSLVGSRQRSRQHTPGTMTPTPSTSSHSRQPSITSLPGIGSSPPLSPTTPRAGAGGEMEKEHELEREISKLRQALEAQQDAALDRLNTKEKEWRAKVEEEREKALKLAKELEEAAEREKKLQGRLEGLEGNKQSVAAQLKQAQGLEAKVVEMQDNYDQLEGLNAQEGAKVKHMLLNANSELDKVREELKQRTEALTATEAKLARLPSLEERLGALSEEKTELETKIAGLKQKLKFSEGRCQKLEEAKEEEVHHLESRIATLEQRSSQSGLQETDRIQALIKERETVEHSLEEARQQLNNIKASWSTKITSLEEQIHHLNAKIAEDQSDLQTAEESNASLTSTLQSVQEELTAVREAKVEAEKRLQEEKGRLEEDVETLKWQLGQKEAREEELMKRLSTEEEKLKSCQGVLQAKIETIASLEISLTDLQGKMAETETNLKSSQEETQKLQAEKKRLQESVARERIATETALKAKGEMESKLGVVSWEKERLSENLDEYANRVAALEKTAMEERKECEVHRERIGELEASLAQASQENQSLQEQLTSSEGNLDQRIEESELVQTLRENVKTLEEELTESKQNLKVQRQRLADMKKTLQRELRLTPDTGDSTAAAAAAQSTAAASAPMVSSSSAAIIDTSSFHSEQQQQHWKEARPGPGNGQATGTNGNDNYFTVNLTYLKHVIIKYLTSREYEAVHLTRAVATLLHMSEEEERLLRETLEWKMSWFGSKPNLGKGQGSLTIPPSQ